MKTNLIAAVVIALSLAGCASNNDYKLYAETQQKIAQAQAHAHAAAETARFAALAEIAKNGDSTARVAAAMSLSLGGGGAGQSIMRQQPVNPPKSFGDTALQWTSVLLPSLTQAYGISANRQIAITQSNNAAATAASTNNAFVSMNAAGHASNTAIAGAGFTAVTTTAANGLTATQNVATAGINGVVTTAANGLTATQNVATAGINGVVTTGANGLTAITNVSNAANTSIQTLAQQLPLLQPNVTTTTTTNQCGSNTTGGTVTCP